jgi:hypothetical protein
VSLTARRLDAAMRRGRFASASPQRCGVLDVARVKAGWRRLSLSVCGLSRSSIVPFPYRLGWQLGSVPASDHPDGLALRTIEKTIGWHYDLPIRKIWKFRNVSPGFGIRCEPPECALNSPAELDSCLRIVLQNIRHRMEKLPSSRGCKPDLHFRPLARRASASARTSSKSNPLPAAISRSP